MLPRVCVALAVVLAGAPPAASAASELPLGPRSLHERRSSAQVAPGVRWTRIVREGGPWRVNVLRVGPLARVMVAAAGAPMGQRARPSALARRARAVAAVNGGYFAADGNPAGALVAGGVLLSEPVAGRTALLLGDSRSLAALAFEGRLAVGGDSRLLDGVNRRPGLVPACGGRGGDRPTERPDATTTCTDSSELIAFTPEWGMRAPSAARAAVVRDGVVTRLAPAGGASVPPDGVVLSGTGSAARFLERFADVGAPLDLDLALDAGRKKLAPGSLAGIVGGGPRLLSLSRIRVRAGAEGFAPLSAPWFYGSFVAARQPRTLAGLSSDGSLLLVTVDGRRAGWSAGVTLLEAARLMRSLGAREALNLDGGGSSAMTVRGRVVSRPSDTGGERPVSDALVVLP
jgi:hypothetical protein